LSANNLKHLHWLYCALLFTLPVKASTPPAVALPKMCVGQACLGMTVREAADLPWLEIPDNLKMSFKHDSLMGNGLDSGGQKVWIGMGNFDRRSIHEYVRRVQVTCLVEEKTGWLKSSDGDKVFVHFNPAIVQGRGTLIVTGITRVLDLHMSDAQIAALTEQARQRYGTTYSEWPVVRVERPAAWMTVNFSHGRVLELALPKPQQEQALLSQSGCSTPTHID
jgi:hypothetical protein